MGFGVWLSPNMRLTRQLAFQKRYKSTHFARDLEKKCIFTLCQKSLLPSY